MEDLRELYTVGKWKGMANYECRLCPFSTVEGENVISGHIVKRHGPKPVKRVELPLVDSKGDPLTVEVEEGGGRETLPISETEEFGS